ncbi:MAG: hypothetical protein KDA99_25315 [Planctomycetales bacterium]|nr:hypothetical protein [Planctomycetales bacterium]
MTLMCLCGCGDPPPQAPALRNGPVYQNDAAGLRFLVPDMWQQTASSALPRGELEKEILLARYQLQTSASGGSLEVYCMNDSPLLDLLTYHRAPSFGVAEWNIIEGPEEIQFQGITATHLLLAGTVNNNQLGKDVTVFRRGARVFSFVGLYSLDDPNARQQIERAVRSVVWKE